MKPSREYTALNRGGGRGAFRVLSLSFAPNIPMSDVWPLYEEVGEGGQGAGGLGVTGVFPAHYPGSDPDCRDIIPDVTSGQHIMCHNIPLWPRRQNVDNNILIYRACCLKFQPRFWAFRLETF